MQWKIVVTCIALFVSLQAQDSRAALVGHWTFDTTGDFADKSSNNLGGTVGGSGALAGVTGQGRPTGVLQLGGSGYVNVPDNNLLDLPNTFTIAAWFKPTVYPDVGLAAHIVRKLNTNGSGGPGSEVYFLRLYTTTHPVTRLSFLVYANNPSNNQVAKLEYDRAPPNFPFPVNQWSFVAITYNGNDLDTGTAFWLNDMTAPVVTTGGNIAPRATTDVLRIGSGPSGSGFKGYLDDVWIFNHALSSSELASVKAGTYVPPTLAGDYNGDGKVDAADYIVWRKNPGAFGGATGYTTWQQNFGKPAASGSASSLGSVPEPAAVLYVLAGCFSVFSVRPRRRGRRK